MDAVALTAVLGVAADAARAAVERSGDFSPTGGHEGQHAADVAADTAAVAVLAAEGLGVLSEESGRHPGRGASAEVTVVLDPLDGSTNAAHGLPWYATSLCAVDGDGPLAALVVDHVAGTRYEATRGGGARRDGEVIHPSGVTALSDALVALSDLPPEHLGWRQFRTYGAVALDLCAVAEGRFDAFVDCGRSAHAPWDYLGGLLVCREAGVEVADALGRPLVVVDHDCRRTPVAAATPALAAEVAAARARFPA